MIYRVSYRGIPLPPVFRCPLHLVPYDTRLHAPGLELGMAFSNYAGKGRHCHPSKTTFYTEDGKQLELREV
jgi:hypothetical protein